MNMLNYCWITKIPADWFLRKNLIQNYMKRTALYYALTVILIITTASSTFAQDTVSVPDTLRGWDTSWQLGLNGSQASYSNWSQGGVNNIAATGSTTFTSVYKKDRFSYGFLANARFGKTKIENEGIRKIDDRLFILNRFLYDLGEDESDFKLYANIRFRTQFDKGFNYGAEPKELISKFLAPAYLSQDAGLAYIPSPMFSFEAGLGLQQTIVIDSDLSAKYGLSDGDSFSIEPGITLGSTFNAAIAENLQLSSSINTFTNFGKPLKSTDIWFSNKLVASINRYLNTTFSLDFVYNDDFSDEIQVAQVLSVGVSFTLR